ncbi:hypothetical protein SFB85_07265 [Legionella taurinensis]|nr:hypothetical protein [Legionella taurinensis]MDX1837380.1 hypothetical protein [Legionella taurinensis]STY25649.1 Uncharacterised protein [Legionella taurinensis]
MDILINTLGYIASSLVFAAFYVKRIMTLRLIAIGSNVAFIAYATTAHLLPIFILHSLLLPLNIHRILELRRNLKLLAEGQADEKSIKKLLGPRWMNTNEMVFKDGKTTWTVYLLKADSEGMACTPEVPSDKASIFDEGHNPDNIYVINPEKPAESNLPLKLIGYDKASNADMAGTVETAL